MLRKLKVCFVAEEFYPGFTGGGGIYAYRLVEGLAERGVKVTVLAERREGREKFWSGRENIRLFQCPYCFQNQLFLGLMQYFWFLAKLRDERFDVVHATQLSGLGFVFFKPRNISRVLLTVNHTFYEMYRSSEWGFKRIAYWLASRLEKAMYQRAEAIHFHNDYEQKQVTNFYGVKRAEKKTVYLGVDFPRIEAGDRERTKRQMRKELRIAKGEKIVLYVGRLVRRKKVEVLLKALGLLDRRKIKVRGVIVGRGPDMERLQKMAPANVVFLGFVPETRPYFLAADVFVLTAIAEGGVALGVLEAASFGLPIIISPEVAGMPVVREGGNGYIVGASDYRKLAKCIKDVLPRSKEMGKVSRQKVREFSWERCVLETIRLYRSLV